MAARHPVLSLLHASANGGKRHIRTARLLKAEGVKAGVPDLFLPVARFHQEWQYYGLFIEMKTRKGRVTPEQKWWHAQLEHQGYRVEVCRGAQAAISVLSDYLGI
jgi:hypothetical protein